MSKTAETSMEAMQEVAQSPEKLESLYKFWMNEIDDGLKREKKFREKGKRYVGLYEGDNSEQTPYSILYSNTEVLVPAVYNAKPVPMVVRRFKDEDPLGRVTSEVGTRLLKFMIEAEAKDYDSFDELISPAVLEAFLVNRGLTRFKYVPDEKGECVYGEAVRWDKFLHGYARTWKKVPWAGFEWDMSKQEIKDNFKDIQVNWTQVNSSSDENEDSSKSKDEMAGVKTYKVFEIWCKDTGMVYFFSKLWVKGPMRAVQDPYGLTGFFPIPRPMCFMRKVSTLIPTPLYEHYKAQAEELNDITRRLRAIIKAVKYRGAYNAAVDGIEKMLEAEDNTLVPVENVASMPDGSGMDKLLWTVPVQELAATAVALSQQREQVKTVIYEITGVSDILRGSTAASETAAAQTLKSQWGTLRLKKMQKEVQRYCRDSLAIMLEIAANKFEQATVQRMTGLPYLTNQQKMAIQQQQMQAAQQAQMQSQMSGQPAPPPQPLPPEVQGALNLPSWEDIMGLLHDSLMRTYKTDIETNSTIDAEASQDKQDISELLNALSQFLNGIAPLVQEGVLPFDIAKIMLLTISRRFNFGSQLEDALNAMQAPPPKSQGPSPEDQAKLAVVQAQSTAATQKAQQDAALSKQEFDQKQAEAATKAQLSQMEMENKRAQLGLQAKELEMKSAFAEEQFRLKMATAQHKAKQDQKRKPANASV